MWHMTMKILSFSKRTTLVLTEISWLGFLCLAIILCCSPARAQGTYTAATCNQSDVNAVINGPTHTAVNGDTIIIPVGTCTWTSGITISGVGIDITGTGTPNTGASTFGAGTTNTTIIDNVPGSYTTSQPMIEFINLTPGETAKVELLTLSASGASANQFGAAVLFSGTCTNTAPYCASARGDNINFAAGTWENATVYAFFLVTNVYGVVDHNTFNEATTFGGPTVVTPNYGSWHGVGSYGDNSMAAPDTFGTNEAFYLENNSITGLRGTDVPGGTQGENNQGGARYVCRFNHFTPASGSGMCPNHGTAWSGRPRGVRQAEVYYNTDTTSSCQDLTNLLGGTGRFLSNSVSGPGCTSFVNLSVPRFTTSPAPTAVWGACGEGRPWDQSPFTPTSGCLDQAGTGAAGLLAGGSDLSDAGVTMNGIACGGAGIGVCWPNGASDPVYEAGDTVTGSLSEPVRVNTDGSSTRILPNSSYYAEVSQTAQTSTTSPFNGTTGTGYGTLAFRPTTCTAGVGYWATDQGTWNNGGPGGVLYTCNSSGNAWTATYTPYTYPHPLVTGGSAGSSGNSPNPPTGLTATVD
jgi:hypothetical protein